jgi:hypothetical protein
LKKKELAKTLSQIYWTKDELFEIIKPETNPESHPGMGEYTYNPSTLEVEARGPWVEGHSETLSQETEKTKKMRVSF